MIRVGIEEGHNAECIAVGVARWSINMGVYSLQEKSVFDCEGIEGELIMKRSESVLNNAYCNVVKRFIRPNPVI